MPVDLGLPLLAHRRRWWYLDAFFFELLSAYDTLLQELNAVYANSLSLEPKQVRWFRIEGKLPKELSETMRKASEENWFKTILNYRNVATHHYGVLTGSVKGGSGSKPLDYDKHQVFIYHVDASGELQQEKVEACIEYLRQMVRFISSVWGQMSKEFAHGDNHV